MRVSREAVIGILLLILGLVIYLLIAPGVFG